MLPTGITVVILVRAFRIDALLDGINGTVYPSGPNNKKILTSKQYYQIARPAPFSLRERADAQQYRTRGEGEA